VTGFVSFPAYFAKIADANDGIGRLITTQCHFCQFCPGHGLAAQVVFGSFNVKKGNRGSLFFLSAVYAALSAA
jgi:hypothetical protein